MRYVIAFTLEMMNLNLLVDEINTWFISYFTYFKCFGQYFIIPRDLLHILLLRRAPGGFSFTRVIKKSVQT